VPAEAKPPGSKPAARGQHDPIPLRDAAWAANLTWRSAQCSTQSCIEVAQLTDGGIAIRDGKAGDTGDVLIFSGDEWSAFVTGIKAGEFD
jgi:hypothetical protein